MIGAGIVTYNPDITLLKKNLNGILKQVDEVVIVDNGSNNIEDLVCLLEEYRVDKILNQENEGIARALNQIMEWFEKKTFAWVLTLDQDTICPDNLVFSLKQYVAEDIGIVAPAFYNRDAERVVKKNPSPVEQVEWAITSASLTNVAAWKKINGFDEKLFIDGVDIDFGIRLNKNGYRVVKLNTICISHKIGDSFVRQFWGRQVLVQNHNAFRKYYMSRNTIILAKKHLGKKGVFFAYLKVVKLFLLVVLFEKQKNKKIKAIACGILDANKYFGKEI